MAGYELGDAQTIKQAINELGLAEDATVGRLVDALQSEGVDSLRVDLVDESAGLASETTLASLAAEDFATEATLSSLLSDFQAEDFAQEATLSALQDTDFATEATLGELTTALASQASDELRVDLVTTDVDIATEATLASLDATDFATETTLTDLAATDFATEATLSDLLTAFTNEDFAQESTLSGLANTDFATETTLADLNATDFATTTDVQAVESAVQADQPRTVTQAETVQTKSGFDAALTDGRAFVQDTGTISVEDSFNVLLENPTADRLCVISRMVSDSGTEAEPEIQVNPDMDLPTTKRGEMNLYSAGPATQMDLYADDQATGMSGGGTGVYLTITGSYRVRDFPFVLAPGDSVGFVTEASGGLSGGTDVKLSVFYHEVPL